MIYRTVSGGDFVLLGIRGELISRHELEPWPNQDGDGTVLLCAGKPVLEVLDSVIWVQGKRFRGYRYRRYSAFVPKEFECYEWFSEDGDTLTFATPAGCLSKHKRQFVIGYFNGVRFFCARVAKLSLSNFFDRPVRLACSERALNIWGEYTPDIFAVIAWWGLMKQGFD